MALAAAVLDQALLADLSALVAADRQTTAALLAHIAEVDARQLYLPAACASMHVYCVRALHIAEEVAFKRIRAARAARRFPQIFAAIADGRLHVSGVVLLAPHLTDDNADELSYDVFYRREGETAWKPLKRGMSEQILVWDTTSVPSGRYTVRIVASDVPSNSTSTALSGARESTAFAIDNVPPVIAVTSARRDNGRTEAQRTYRQLAQQWREMAAHFAAKEQRIAQRPGAMNEY